jgi:mono/diheme cytochrome c family protein
MLPGVLPVRCGVLVVLATLLATATIGCRPSAAPHFVASEQVGSLDPELQQQIDELLRKFCGTPNSPRMLGSERNDDAAFRRHLQLGAEVYAQRCEACHGVTGDGNGPAAAYLQPRPRDYRRGIFKFTSTPYGAKPRREDLERTIRRGVIGTSMPSFALLSDEDVTAVVDYVLVLAMRGELEYLLASEAESEDELDPEVAEEYGEDGRGLTQENVGTDAWGFSTRAADLTSGMLRGGRQPLDIYRRISSGINGTPMPSFHNALAEEPETIWNLAHYVLSVSNRRREGILPTVVEPVPSAAEAPVDTPASLPETTTEPAEPSEASPSGDAATESSADAE